MRVLVLTMWYPSEESPTSGTFVNEQSQAIKTLGVDIRVVQPIPFTPFPINIINEKYRKFSEFPMEKVTKGVKVYHPRYLTLPRSIFYKNVGKWMYNGILKTVLNIYKTWPFDIIHAHATYPCGFCANMIRNRHLPHIKTIHTIHRFSIIDVPNYNPRCKKRVITSLTRSDWNIFVSMEGYRIAQSYTNGMIDEKSSYITNGVNISQFELKKEDEEAVEALRKEYGDSLNILFVGYLSKIKGIKDLLPAFKTLRDNGPKGKIRLFLVGKNADLGTYIENFVKRNDLGKDIITVGPVLHDHVKRWLSFADIFILPSHSEGLATVLFESLYMGKPAVFTKVGGTCDVVNDMEHALLINPKSKKEIVSTLSRLIKDSKLRQQLSRNAHRLIKDKYTWGINAERNMKIYLSLLPMHSNLSRGNNEH